MGFSFQGCKDESDKIIPCELLFSFRVSGCLRNRDGVVESPQVADDKRLSQTGAVSGKSTSLRTGTAAAWTYADSFRCGKSEIKSWSC